METPTTLSSAEVLKLLGGMQTAVEATTSSATPLLTKYVPSTICISSIMLVTYSWCRVRNDDPSLDTASGLSLLLLRPQLLLASLHNLVIQLSLRLATGTSHQPSMSDSTAATTSFDTHQRDRREVAGIEDFLDEISGELALGQEVFDKVRGMEGKLEYQIKKLIGLADAEEKRGREVVDDAEEGEHFAAKSFSHRMNGMEANCLDPLSFRPNPAAFASSSTGKASKSTIRSAATANGDDEATSGKYVPPRIAAVPYDEPASSSRRDRRAPALLSEFAYTMDGAPVLESTSGLSTRPVQHDRTSNSTSAKRAAELERMNRFEEENMTRLVTTKREEKRRREDEAALALGYGVGGKGRNKGTRQNGLEAELEGVLGERRSKGLWEGVRKDLGAREGLLERGKKRSGTAVPAKSKKARFEKDVQGHQKRSKRS